MFFVYSVKPAEHTISAFIGAFLKQYLVLFLQKKIGKGVELVGGGSVINGA